MLAVDCWPELRADPVARVENAGLEGKDTVDARVVELAICSWMKGVKGAGSVPARYEIRNSKKGPKEGRRGPQGKAELSFLQRR